MHLLVQRYIQWGRWSGFSERGCQDLSNGTKSPTVLSVYISSQWLSLRHVMVLSHHAIQSRNSRVTSSWTFRALLLRLERFPCLSSFFKIFRFEPIVITHASCRSNITRFSSHFQRYGFRLSLISAFESCVKINNSSSNVNSWRRNPAFRSLENRVVRGRTSRFPPEF
jgi:hypothetical protein